jgi:hypothetical protein
MSKSITNVNGHIVEKSFEDRDGKIVSVTRVLNGKQDVLIEESDELGIKVTIKESIRGKEKKSEYQAEDRKALRKKHPAAFEWVRKYASEPTQQVRCPTLWPTLRPTVFLPMVALALVALRGMLMGLMPKGALLADPRPSR